MHRRRRLSNSTDALAPRARAAQAPRGAELTPPPPPLLPLPFTHTAYLRPVAKQRAAAQPHARAPRNFLLRAPRVELVEGRPPPAPLSARDIRAPGNQINLTPLFPSSSPPVPFPCSDWQA